MKKILLAGAAAIGLMAGIQASAHASVYDFTYAGTGYGFSDHASGTLTIGAVSGRNSAIKITGITGTFDDSAITGLLRDGAYQSNDNRLYNPDKSDDLGDDARAYLDFQGLSFATASGQDVNIYFNYLTYAAYTGRAEGEGCFNPSLSFGDFDVTPTAPVAPAPVPEPGSLALLGTGLLGLVFAMRRRRRLT